MKAPPSVLIPAHISKEPGSHSEPGHAIPEFDPIHPLAAKLRHLLASPETATVGSLAGVIEQLIGELHIMAPAAGGIPPPPQPMPAPSALRALPEISDAPLTDDEKTQLGQFLMALDRKRSVRFVEAA